jgi:murein DD-endopeptidase MepM/ murein hydrolase activator NlpD
MYGYQNKEKLQSPEFQNEIKTFLNTKINIKDIFSTQIKEKEMQNAEVSETQSLLEETPIEQINEQVYNVIWPYKGEITSNFGQRSSEDVRVSNNHTGIDIAGNTGDKIVSAINGKVTMVSEEGNLGKHIKIENNEFTTVYAHCNNIYVIEGDEIRQGQEIGEIGSTGNSTGSHLHFEVLRAGDYIDPLTIIEKKVENEN